MASRAAARSGANSSRVELTNTRTRWSGVRITAGLAGAAVGWLAASSGNSVAIVSQPLSWNHVSFSITCTPPELGDMLQHHLSASLLVPFTSKYNEGYDLVTPHHLLVKGSNFLFTSVVYLALLLSSNSEH